MVDHTPRTVSPSGELLTWERVAGLQRQMDRIEGKMDTIIALGRTIEGLDGRVKALELAAASESGSRVSRGKVTDYIMATLLAIIGSGVWVSFFIHTGP